MARAVVAWGLRWGARLSARPAAVALLYHPLAPGSRLPGDELVGMLGAEEFAAHLRHLRRRYRVVEAHALLEAMRARRRGGRVPVAITFDDDLLSHLRLAAPELRRLGLPATVFLTGAGLQEGGAFWWQSLQAAIDAGADIGPALAQHGVPAGPLRGLGRAIEQLERPARQALGAALERLAGPDLDRRGLRVEEVRALARAGVTIGFHTRHHDRLTRLGPDARRLALREGREAVEAAAGAPCDLIAYPHGDADADVALQARQAGFELGFTTARAAIGADSDPLLLPRPELLADGGRFALQLATVLQPFGRAWGHVGRLRALRPIRTS